MTPYVWAVALARELTGGVLLTWRGQSHVAYYYSSCVRTLAQAYLVAGTLPGPGDHLHRLRRYGTGWHPWMEGTTPRWSPGWPVG